MNTTAALAALKLALKHAHAIDSSSPLSARQDKDACIAAIEAARAAILEPVLGVQP